MEPPVVTLTYIDMLDQTLPNPFFKKDQKKGNSFHAERGAQQRGIQLWCSMMVRRL